MATISSGLQTPAFKAFIDIAPEKHVAGFGSDLDRKPIVSSGGIKGMFVSLYNSIASAFSSKFSNDRAEQATQAHQAFKTALKLEYGTDIGTKVAKRCGLDSALNSSHQLSGVVIQNAFKIAETLYQIAKFEKEVVDNTALNNGDRFQALCKGQGVDPVHLSDTQRDSFDNLVRGSGLINRNGGEVGNTTSNVALLIAGQELAIRVATLPDSAFDKHIGSQLELVTTQLNEGKIDLGKADEMRSKLVDAGRKMEFATGVHALGVGEFISNIRLASTGDLARDLLVLAKTQNAVASAMVDIRTAMGKETLIGADELSAINGNAMNKALNELPSGGSSYRDMQIVALMAKNPSSPLCRSFAVLENIMNEETPTSDQDVESGGVAQHGAARAWSIANTLVGLAVQEANLSSDEIRGLAFNKGEGLKHITDSDTASVLEHVNRFLEF